MEWDNSKGDWGRSRGDKERESNVPKKMESRE